MAPELHLDADLRLGLTTPTGETVVAQVRGTGSHLRVDVDQPQALLEAIGRAEVGRLADLLADLGAVVTVVGPAGQVAVIGAGIRSRLGRLLTGSEGVEPARRLAARMALSSMTPSSRPVQVGVTAVVVFASGLAAVRRTLRR